MALERTLSIVKPDGVSGNHIGEVLRRFEKAGLSIIAARMLQLSQARGRRASTRYTASGRSFKRPGALHELRSGPGDSARGRGRDRAQPRHHGRDRSAARRPRERSARIWPAASSRTWCTARTRHDRRARDRLLLQHHGAARARLTHLPLTHDRRRHRAHQPARPAAPGARGVRGAVRQQVRSAPAS